MVASAFSYNLNTVRTWDKDNTEEYIRQQSGQHFDHQVVERFMGLIGRE